MCLLTFACRQHPQFPLIFAGNRDEFHRRPTAPATFWLDAPGIIGGRDLEAGGSWLGATLGGRFAVVTNYREQEPKPTNARSRGELVAGFLRIQCRPLDFIDRLGNTKKDYAGFNLLCADRDELCYVSNRGGRAGVLAPGVYGLSNELLDTPWPKVARARAALERLLDEGLPTAEALLDLLADRTPALESASSGDGLEPELARRLSAIFVAHPEYGTRCSTVVFVGADGLIHFVERSFAADATPRETRAFTVAPGNKSSSHRPQG
jgi:uncharacterized protein with NRDE domain